MEEAKKAVIIGAGPGGLTAAFEFLKNSTIKPIVIEQSNALGGISQTIDYKGNKIDIGGHRFFSKSDRIMNWWLDILPIEEQNDPITISYQNQKKEIASSDSGKTNPENVMLIRNRLSRILFINKLFAYPLKLNLKTLSQLGFVRTIKIGFSYIYVRIFPIKNEKSLEDFVINRFGRELYYTFFKDYTEKVWGKDCKDIDASWGAQRIKGLSVGKAMWHALTNSFKKKDGVSQKGIETSLIEKFLYPKYGPGQMWQQVAKIVESKGGDILMGYKVMKLNIVENKIISVVIKKSDSGEEREIHGDYFISTMPVKELLKSFSIKPSEEIMAISDGLEYRDFLTVGLLLNKIKVKNSHAKTLPDTWIYVQEKDVKVGRIQFFNNWSPYMVNDPDKVWIGMEYFCNEGDELWTKTDQAMIDFAVAEMIKINFIDQEDFLDAVVIRMPKAYPSYTGTYENFDQLRNYTDSIGNLFLVGRNGMHRYNNQDHSMLTAMLAVENIINDVKTKSNLWEINTEQDYHETK